jgi:hypothetical protein
VGLGLFRLWSYIRSGGGLVSAPCRICGVQHDRHEDAACGCGCGDEPMGCSACMADGGPVSVKSKSQHMERLESRDMDDPEYGG